LEKKKLIRPGCRLVTKAQKNESDKEEEQGPLRGDDKLGKADVKEKS